MAAETAETAESGPQEITGTGGFTLPPLCVPAGAREGSEEDDGGE